MSVVRVIFLGTPDFAVSALEAIAQDEHYEVVRVYTQPDKPAGRSMKIQPTPVKAAAQKLKLDVVNVEDINHPAVIEEIKNLKADIAVVVAFGQILKQPFLDLFPSKTVNIHSSLLPRWRGAAPMQRALMAGDKETGVALQVVVPALDAGPVLGIRKVILTDDVDLPKLYDQLKSLSGELLKLELMDYIRGNLAPVAQDESLKTIAKKIKKEEGVIDWSKSAREILNQVRGLKGWPGTTTELNGHKVKVLEVAVFDETKSAKNGYGQILGLNPTQGGKALIVQCGVGQLAINELQPENRAKMKAEDFVRGYLKL